MITNNSFRVDLCNSCNSWLVPVVVAPHLKVEDRMNERIRVRLMQNGKKLSINSLTSQGIMLNDEADAWPREMMLEFDATNPITKSRMDRIRTIRGWDPMKKCEIRSAKCEIRGISISHFAFRISQSPSVCLGQTKQVSLLRHGARPLRPG